MDNTLVKKLVQSLRSCTCPACGLGKAASQTLCKSCYAALPKKMGVDLYKRVGEGYEESVAVAMAHLGATEFLATDH